MVNKGRINGEIRDFREIFWSSIKSDDELSEKLEKMIDLERELKDESRNQKSLNLDQDSQRNQ